MLARVAVGLVVEVGYAVVTRAWIAHHPNVVERELLVTAVRAATIPIYWALFRDVIRSRVPRRGTRRHPWLACGIILLLLAPALTDEEGLATLTLRLLFAATSIVIGVREELVYRGVLQNLLERRLGWIGAIAVSNVLFVAYHYRMFDFTAPRVATIVLVGSALGLLYHATGSLRLPIAVHIAYDAVAALGPLVPQTISPLAAAGLQLAGLVTLALWVRRLRSSSVRR